MVFDMGVLGWSIILVVLGVIAAVITLSAPKQTPYNEWYAEVERIFYRNGFSVAYVDGLCERDWRDWWTEGLTPNEAVTVYFSE